jgi:hypothetical protein
MGRVLAFGAFIIFCVYLFFANARLPCPLVMAGVIFQNPEFKVN